jgi:hypothetical protein
LLPFQIPLPLFQEPNDLGEFEVLLITTDIYHKGRENQRNESFRCPSEKRSRAFKLPFPLTQTHGFEKVRKGK